MAAKPAAGPQMPLAFDPASYASPGVPVAVEQPAATGSTPRLLWGAKGTHAAPAAAPAPACTEPHQPEPAAAAVGPSAAAPAAASAAAPAPARAELPKPRGLQGRCAWCVQPLHHTPMHLRCASTPAALLTGCLLPSPLPWRRPSVPKLNLSSVGPLLAAGAGAAIPLPAAQAGSSVAKRRRQAAAVEGPEGLSLSSSSSEGSEGGSAGQPRPAATPTAQPAGVAAQPAAGRASPSEGRSKKARPGMSLPRLVVDCGLFEPGSELKLSTASSGSRRCHRPSGAFWPVAAGGGAALCFAPDPADEGAPDAAQQECGEPEPAGQDADDPFSRPAAHDPLLDEESAAATRPTAPQPMACAPASAFCTGAAEVPSSGCSSPEPPSRPASGLGGGGSSSIGAAPSVGLALELLQRGALMLACMPQPLSERIRSDVADVAASLSRMAGLAPAAAPAAPAATPAPPPAAAAPDAAPGSCGRENAASNGNGAAGGSGPLAPADLAAFKAKFKNEILREIRAELRGLQHAQ